jgi:crossover junction endodeoxyribonuclease RuvC
MREVVMGVDGALGTTGIAILADGVVNQITKIRTAKLKATPDESSRLKQIADEFQTLLMFHNPTVVIMENQHVNKLNPRTSLGLARVRGVIQLMCALRNIPFFTLEPSEIKKQVTGKGNAKKEIVQEKIVELYKDQDIVQRVLSKIIPTGKNKTDDMADALAIAHTYVTAPKIAVSA